MPRASCASREPARRAGGWLCGGLLLAGLVPLLGCRGEDADAERSLWELERLTFVPAAVATVEGARAPWADCSLTEPLLVDRFEVSRRDWRYYYPDTDPRTGFSPELGGFSAEQLDWPVYLDQHQAAELAERRGMRLMTSREWIHVALGRRSYPYPWGTERRTSVANTLELGLRTPCAVGTFEGGRSQPFGCYDLLGNVWEWVSDRAPGMRDVTEPDEAWRPGPPAGDGAARAEPFEVVGDDLVSAFGGSFQSLVQKTFGQGQAVRFHALTLDRRTCTPEVGVRHAADARRYLRDQAPRWGRAADAAERVRAVGARWTRTSGREYLLPFLEELLREPGGAPALEWLAEGAREG